MEDVTEAEMRESYRPSSNREETNGSQQGSEAGNGFVVKGAPWEQKAPNTASVEEFPSFGPRGGTQAPLTEAAPPQSAPFSGAWGLRR